MLLTLSRWIYTLSDSLFGHSAILRGSELPPGIIRLCTFRHQSACNNSDAGSEHGPRPAAEASQRIDTVVA